MISEEYNRQANDMQQQMAKQVSKAIIHRKSMCLARNSSLFR